MHLAAIICEYNPFHNGHARQLRLVRELSGADAILLIMSGSYVQRGEPALLDMHSRCSMALMEGADACIELPDFWSSASAAYFAGGAVSILSALNCVDSVWFGSEYAGPELFDRLSSILAEEPWDYQLALRRALKAGLPFPAARASALKELYPFEGLEHFLSQPNHILGLEYCLALKREAGKHPDRKLPVPHVILRNDKGYHSDDLEGSYASATAIRQAILQKNAEGVRDFVPASSYRLLEEQIRTNSLLSSQDLSSLLGAKLMLQDPAALSAYPDIDEDLANRIRNLRSQYQNFEQFSDLLKTRNLTHSHIRRALLHIVLEQKEIPEQAKWIRVIGFRKQCPGLIGTLTASSLVPLILQVRQTKELLSPKARQQFEQVMRNSDLTNYLRAQKSGTSMETEAGRRLIPLE